MKKRIKSIACLTMAAVMLLSACSSGGTSTTEAGNESNSEGEAQSSVAMILPGLLLGTEMPRWKSLRRRDALKF